MTSQTGRLGFDLKVEWIAWFILLAHAIPIMMYWNMLPDQIPIHWNLKGEVDGYGPKALGLLIMPAINVFTYGITALISLLVVIPVEQIAAVRKQLGFVRIILTALFFALHLLMIYSFIHPDANINAVFMTMISAFLIIIGIWMAKTGGISAAGFNTMMQQATDQQRAAINRRAGWMMVALGLLTAAAALYSMILWITVLIVGSFMMIFAMAVCMKRSLEGGDCF